MPFEQAFLFLAGFISILLYSLIVRTLKRHRKTVLLCGTFFRLVELQFYADALFFIEFSIIMRFRKYTDMYRFFEPGTQLAGVVPRVISGIHYYIKLVVYVGYLFFATNRLLSACTVTSYNKENISIWGPRTLNWIKFAQWSVPLLGVLPTHAPSEYRFFLLITSDSIRLSNDANVTALIAYIDGLTCLLVCAYCMIFYVITAILIRKNWKRSALVSKRNSSQSSVERGLLISAVLSFFVLMLNLTVQVLKIIISWNAITNIFSVYDISYPMMDLMYSHFPWVLIVTSSILRRQLVYDVKLLIRKALKRRNEVSMTKARAGQSNWISKALPAS